MYDTSVTTALSKSPRTGEHIGGKFIPNHSSTRCKRIGFRILAIKSANKMSAHGTPCFELQFIVWGSSSLDVVEKEPTIRQQVSATFLKCGGTSASTNVGILLSSVRRSKKHWEGISVAFIRCATASERGRSTPNEWTRLAQVATTSTYKITNDNLFALVKSWTKLLKWEAKLVPLCSKEPRSESDTNFSA